MPEKQNIEYKTSWHDDYLKWICGFANAQGGSIYIGIDDKGNIQGVDNYKKLLDDIPNKVRHSLGITVDVNLLDKDSKKYIEIVVLPYPVPVSLRGRYYYRSGSTKQELTESALTEFLLKKLGKTWDDVIEPRATINDIDLNTFSAFLEMSRAKGRLPDIVGLSTLEIFEKLLLTENGFFKRAAIVLFASNPEKFYPNMFVKIGKWRDNDVLYHDVLEGNLFTLLRNGSNKINYDYTKRKIHFEGLYRVETAEYPEEAIREMLLNALVHRSYMGAPIQIRVYDDKLNIWNEGSLPTGVSVESLRKPHSSRPRNPIIAGVCFKSGLVEAWGSGTLKIIDSCVKAGLPEPDLTEQDGGFLVTLFKELLYTQEIVHKSLNERQVKAIAYLRNRGRITNKEYQQLFEVARNTASRDLIDLKEKGLIKSSESKGAGSYYEL